MTLTEFLLARIAEDEEDVPTLGYTTHLTPGRRLAECEAKRRIVEFGDDAGWAEVHVDAWTAMKIVLREMAAVYADHPDYREEWKP